MTFSDIVGHKIPLRLLSSALASGRLAHAYLFHGEEGIGKRSVAEIFARGAMCSGEAVPCNLCPSCTKFLRGVHPDLHRLSPSGAFIKIEHVREVESLLVFRPAAGKRKVVLIDEADRMKEETANALLKTLEEPPPETLLILITPHPQALLPTMISRCEQVRFIPPSFEECRAGLESRELTRQDTERLLAILGNRPGPLFSTDVESAAQEASRLAALVRLDRLARPDEVLALAYEFSRDAETFDRTLRFLAGWLASIAYLHAGVSQSSPPDPSLEEERRRWAQQVKPERIEMLLSLVARLHRAAVRNVNRQLSLEALLFAVTG